MSSVLFMMVIITTPLVSQQSRFAENDHWTMPCFKIENPHIPYGNVETPYQTARPGRP